MSNYLSVVPYGSCLHPLELSFSSLKTADGVFDSSISRESKEYHHFGKYSLGDIVVLVGTSTSGKSSIIQALKALEPERLEDGFDLRYFNKHLDSFKKYCLRDVEIVGRVLKDLVDIPKAVLYGERNWKVGILPFDKIQAEKAIARIKNKIDSLPGEEKAAVQHSFKHMEKEMFEGVLERSYRGGSSVFDVTDAEPFIEHAKQRKYNAAIRIMLIYCPFVALSSRMDDRNAKAFISGDFSNQRVGTFPLEQFSTLYGKKTKRQKTLEVIDRSWAKRVFHTKYDEELEQAKKDGESHLPEDLQREDKKKLTKIFLKNLGFEKGEYTVEVAPKNPHLYTSVIDSFELEPRESAEIIHRGTFKQ